MIRSSILSTLFFSSMRPVIRTANQRAIELADLPEFPPHLEPASAEKLEGSFNRLRMGSANSFLVDLVSLHGRYLGASFSCTVLRLVLALISPMLIYDLIQSLSRPDSARSAIVSAVLIAVAGVLGGVVINQTFYRDFVAFQVQQHFLNTLLFRKLLRLSPEAKARRGTGEINNLFNSDTQTVAMLGFILNDGFYILALSGCVIAMLFKYLGAAALAGMMVLLVMTPISRKVMKRFERHDGGLSELRDQRVDLISQAINGIRSLKLYRFEKQAESEIEKVRARELAILRTKALHSAFSFMVFGSTTALVSFVSFGARYLWTGQLDSATVFASLALIVLLEIPFSKIPDLIGEMAGVRVATDRIRAFLRDTEIPTHRQSSRTGRSSAVVGVRTRGLSCQPEGAQLPVIDQLSFDIPPGQSVALVGAVGSGKSLLLRSLIGEAPGVSGSIQWVCAEGSLESPRLAYAAQEPFIIAGSLRDNLVFGRSDVSEEELVTALQACALEEDVRALPAGLDTEIGERGINLSGGQRQRVSLARALLARPQAVFLDDPFSAVDARTESRLVHGLVFGALRGVTRVVATHRIASLDRFDRVIFMQNGRILADGSPASVLAMPELKPFFEIERNQAHSPNAESDPIAASAQNLTDSSTAGRLTDDESRHVGRVPIEVFLRYVRAMSCRLTGKASPIVAAWLVLSVFGVVLAPIAQIYWLAQWSSGALNQSTWLTSEKGPLWVYGILGVISLAFVFGQRWAWFRQAALASERLHASALRGVLRAPIRFFDSTPAGVILNRFSKDLNLIEKELRWTFENFVRFSFNMLVNLVMMAAAVPVLAVLSLPVLFLYFRVQREFRSGSREVKRLAQVQQSPLHSLLKESGEGLPTLRSLGAEARFARLFHERHRRYQLSARNQEMVDRWFSVRVPVISGGISLVVSVGLVLGTSNGTLSIGVAGLLLTYLINFWPLLNWSVRTLVLVEGSMTSVERLEYLADLDPENDVAPERSSRHEHGPGAIEFEGVAVKYADHLPEVLKGVSFRVEPGTRVGIIGRTGSGKSTLLQALVGFAPITRGSIRLNGRDLREIPLEELRRRIAVVPQTPFLFHGTVRSNLDPQGEREDQEINDVLRRLQLFECVAQLPHGLDTPIHDGSQAFSHGQRQLICLARALLQRPEILVLDEATAGIDIQTERLIQDELRRVWEGMTVLVIAHRIATIADADRIISLEGGSLVPESTPMSVNSISEIGD